VCNLKKKKIYNWISGVLLLPLRQQFHLLAITSSTIRVGCLFISITFCV